MIALALLAAYVIVAVFASYIITAVLVTGHLFTYPRCRFRLRTLWLIKGPPEDRRHPIDCRLCTGAWVSAAITIVAIASLWGICGWASLDGSTIGLVGSVALLLCFPLIYGASYFLCTQER